MLSLCQVVLSLTSTHPRHTFHSARRGGGEGGEAVQMVKKNCTFLAVRIYWGSSPGVFSGYSGFLPSFIGLMVQPMNKAQINAISTL